MTNQAYISPSMLSWARERSNMTIESLAEKLGLHDDKLLAWEAGESTPTFLQARHLASALHVPFGMLFIESKPDETLPLPDLRTITNERVSHPSPEFRDTLYSCLRKQEWFSAELRESGADTVAWVGSCSVETPVEEAARKLIRILGKDTSDPALRGSWTEYLTYLCDAAEDSGAMVFRNGVVGSNTHRALDVREFRGFAISDAYAPAVFINTNDAESAKIFTLAHELAHLLLGQSGISDVGEGMVFDESDARIERWCDSVAAETLCPASVFRANWNDAEGLEYLIQSLARKFKVSTVVILRRALDLGLIDRGTFFERLTVEKERQKGHEKAVSGGGPPPRVIIPWRNGKRLTERVLVAVSEERISWKEAATLLDSSVSVVDGLSRGVSES